MREDVYIGQLKALGVWQEAFLPLVKDLAKAERRRTRAEKEWSATVPKGGKPSFTHPLYQTIVQLDRTVMDYREALGLTPKALRRLMGSPEPPVQQDLITEKLTQIAAKVSAYEIPVLKMDTKCPSQSPPQAAATALPEKEPMEKSAEAGWPADEPWKSRGVGSCHG